MEKRSLPANCSFLVSVPWFTSAPLTPQSLIRVRGFDEFVHAAGAGGEPRRQWGGAFPDFCPGVENKVQQVCIPLS